MAAGQDLMQRYLGVAPKAPEEAVLRLLIETAVKAVGGEEGSLLVYDPQTRDLIFLMTYGGSENVLVGQRVPLNKGVTGLAAATGEVQIGAPTFKDVQQSEAIGTIQNVIAAPMMLGDRLIGVITAVSNKAGKRFTMADGGLYANVATIAALMVDQSLRLRAQDEAAAEKPLAYHPEDAAEREVLERVSRLLQKDPATIRQVAKVLEAIELMAPSGAPS
jgi:hypothetical protein